MELDELLAHVAAMRLILAWSRRGKLVLWSPNTKVPRRIRSAISAHRQELQALIATDDVSVCPAHMLHYREWRYDHGCMVCSVCERLRRWI